MTRQKAHRSTEQHARNHRRALTYGLAIPAVVSLGALPAFASHSDLEPETVHGSGESEEDELLSLEEEFAEAEEDDYDAFEEAEKRAEESAAEGNRQDESNGQNSGDEADADVQDIDEDEAAAAG